MIKLIIFPIFNYSPPGLPMKLGRAHDPPFGPKTELTIPKYLDRGPKNMRALLSSTQAPQARAELD